MRSFIYSSLLAAVTLAFHAWADPATNNAFPVTITVDAARPLGELRPFWRFFGADEAELRLHEGGQEVARRARPTR